ncbi:MAG: hypothetical protein ACRENE_09760 [Polyangiaceae bacterium]
MSPFWVAGACLPRPGARACPWSYFLLPDRAHTGEQERCNDDDAWSLLADREVLEKSMTNTVRTRLAERGIRVL